MDQSKPSSVTIEEAVARMVNMDYIPTGFTLLEMVDAFRIEAEIEYEDAVIDGVSPEKLAPLKVRRDACQKRHTLAKHLLESLQQELKAPDSEIVRADDSSSQDRLTLESVSYWAADRYGIGIPEWAPEVTEPDVDLTGVKWEDVIIKIYTNNRIAYSFGDGKFRESTFAEVGLMDKRKNTPNHQAGILLGLSRNRKYPSTAIPSGREKATISKLRRVLKKLTCLSADPFSPFIKTQGWRPRFKLIDDRRNADERAKKKALFSNRDVDRIGSGPNEYPHEPEAKDFDEDDDVAGEYLRDNR